MPKREKIWKVEAEVELEVPRDMVNDVKSLEKELNGEFVKVKGGQYENIAMGCITKVGKISPSQRTWE